MNLFGLGALALGALALSRPKTYSITVDTFEGTTPYPAVTHTFTGKTLAEAAAYERAHRKTDAFYAACWDGRFRDFSCRNVVREK